MHLRDILRTQLGRAQERFGPVNILETGTIRNTDPQYELDDGWSTVTFAEWCREHGGTIESVDLEIEAAATVLEKRGLRDVVHLVRHHSIHFLGARLFSNGTYAAGYMLENRVPEPKVHVAYLDSDNDPTLILDEYLLVTQMMPSGAILMVDDCDPVAGGHKGDKIIPWLKEHGQAFELVRRTGVGYATNVLITRVP